MYLVLIAWLYVTLMMSVAEATAPQGTVLGAAVTFVLYGLLPMGIVGYILGTPARRRARKAQEQAELQAWQAAQQQPPDAPVSVASATPDAGGEAPADTIAPVRKEL